MNETKAKILDAAKKLFAQNGFDATSLRAITKEAGVNLAAVNYHFQSKDALIQEMFAQHIGPLNAERLRLLDEAEARAAGAPVPIDQLVEAFSAPMLELRANYGEGTCILLGRIFAEPGDLMRRVIAPQMAEIKSRFHSAFYRALPELPKEELYWRINLLIGALAHALAARGLLEAISEGKCSSSDMESARKYLIRFAMGAFQAPAISEKS